MLKQRFWTALVLAPIVLAGLFLLSFELFKLFIAAIVLLGAWEWANLSGIQSATGRFGYVSLVAALLALANYILPGGDYESLLLLAVGFWIVALFWVVNYPSAKGWQSGWQRFLIGLVVLVPSWMALVSIQRHPGGDVILLMLLLLIWGADIGAYFAGKTWGNKKLAPHVSPGKTLAGLWGGLVACALVSLGFIVYLELELMVAVYLLLLSVIAGLVSVLGDLFESMLKRYRGIKDSSNLLPGHGGILDRIDSITSAAPLFVVGIHALPIF
ncbi:phosphatidate cytidylyltransferase [Amphritea sp. HPY]|uniref:phosphatidate cytidylyltransferase n=1 Tax=Amphritea sp. HPY TaxID=3421652 RepID=UPI003D7E60F0